MFRYFFSRWVHPLIFRSKSHSIYLLLNTTQALYSTLTDVFLDEAKNLDSCKGMKFDPPSNIGYKPYLDTLEANGRTINTTVASQWQLQLLVQDHFKLPDWDRILPLSSTNSNPRKRTHSRSRK